MKTAKRVVKEIESLLRIQKGCIDTGYMAGLYNGLEIARRCIIGGDVELINNPDKSFIQHIKSHLLPDEKVICKICGKSVEEIEAGEK